MKKFIYLILITILISLLSCNSASESLDKLWFYTHESKGSGRGLSINAMSFINLKKDGSYIMDLKKFDYGHWEKNDSALELTSKIGPKVQLRIRGYNSKDLQLIPEGKIVLHFESQPAKFSSDAENPFSLENNQWRIPAIKKESDLELRKRLANHCRFYESYFTWALENEIKTVDVRSTPSSIKIYGNGFKLKDVSELPATWRSYFYDEEDCEKANLIIKGIFQKENIAWPRTDNKYKMFISAFQQLQVLLDPKREL